MDLAKTRSISPIEVAPAINIRALSSFWDFLEYIDYKGGVENFSKIHKELSGFITIAQAPIFTKTAEVPLIPKSKRERRRLVLMPRGHLKSTLCSVAYVLWRIWRNPNIRIAVCTATKELSLQFIREVKQYLESEELQERVWNNRPHIQGRMVPVLDKVAARRRDRLSWEEDNTLTEAVDKKVVWRADAIQVMRSQILKEPTVIASSPGANITGMHFDLVINDDIINDDTVASQGKIDKTLNWAVDLESVIDPQRMMKLGSISNVNYFEVVGDEVLILGTRYARHEYYGYILDNLDLLEYSTFIRNVYVNGVDNKDGYIWGERFNDDVVERLKRRMTAKKFASQYLNKIMADEDIILTPDAIQYICAEDFEIKDGYVYWSKLDENKVMREIRVKPIIMIDPAISQKKGADYSVLTVGGQDDKRNLYIFDVIFGKFLPDTIIEKLYLLANRWKVNVCHVETVAFQQALIHIIKKAFGKHRPLVLNEYRPRGEKKARIATFLEPIFANKQIYLERRLASMSELREELTYFPQESVKDDIIDTFAMIAEVTQPTIKKASRANVIPFRPTNKKYGGIR